MSLDIGDSSGGFGGDTSRRRESVLVVVGKGGLARPRQPEPESLALIFRCPARRGVSAGWRCE